MNEKKLKLLIEYLEVLGKIEGNYYSEINNAIKAIESEFKIVRNENKERSGFISNGLQANKIKLGENITKE